MNGQLFRALLLGGAAALVAGAVAPHGWPDFGPLATTGDASTELATFGLQAVATLLAGYAALVCLALVVGEACRLPLIAAVALRRWTDRGLAGMLRRSLGLSLAVAAALPTAAAAANPLPSAPPVLAPADLPTTTGPPVTTATSPPVVERHHPPPRPEPPRPAHHRMVVPGDSFWSIAESVVAARLGHVPNDTEVAPYWVDLIDANRSRLVDPGDPDLLLPGQELRLPP